MKKITVILVSFLCFFGILSAAPFSNDTFTFQGYLTDSAGAPVFGSRWMAFKIYDSASGSTVLADIDARSVVIYNGNYATKIKITEHSALNKLNQADDAWIQIWVKTDNSTGIIADQYAMRPRIQLTAVPYALTTRGIYYDNANQRIGIGTKTPTATLDVAGNINTTGGKIQENNNALIPKGVIVMWTGTIAPAGWTLCDGTNGAPDLRDKFVLGAGGTLPSSGGSVANTLTGSYTPAGAAAATVLSSNQIPAHAHSGTTAGMDRAQAHSHGFQTAQASTGAGGVYSSNYGSQLRPDGSTFSTNIDHLHTFTTNTDGGGGLGHSHGFTGTAATISTSGNTIPPYYALAYIMKL